MFDIGAIELLVVVIAAILVIGPKDMPMALRSLGRWIAKVRQISGHFRAGVDTMIREAEMEDLEKKWKERNDRIMAQGDAEVTEMTGPPAQMSDGEPPASDSDVASTSPETGTKTGAKAGPKAGPDETPDAASAEARANPAKAPLAKPSSAAEKSADEGEPKLPFDQDNRRAS